MGVRWTELLGTAVVAVALSACGGDGGDGGEDPGEQNNPGEPSQRTESGISEACSLFPGPSTQVNLTANAAGAPLINSSTSYHVITAEGAAGWSGYFSFTSGGGDVVFSVDTTAVTLDIPQGQAKPPTPTFIITSNGGAVSASEAVAAPLECTSVVGAYRYELAAGTYQVLVNPTAWYQFRLVASEVD
ncbi:MAG: hypothetical protein ACAI38_08075 [Myxococcota bacterium]|nr:hypothetical protein [Myxococcota bacterium]